jgi:minor extracellular serine protease Vpr
MQRFYAVFFALALVSGSFSAQAVLSAPAKTVMLELNPLIQKRGEPSPELIKSLSLDRKNGQWRIGMVAHVNPSVFREDMVTGLGGVIQSRTANMRTMRVPVMSLPALFGVEGIRYIEMGEMFGPELELSRKDTRVDSVHAGAAPLSRSYSGKGVIVAVIDWGFDFNHPVFYDTTLTQLRVTRCWDQVKTSGPAPSGFDYGTEIVGASALMLAKEDTQFYFGPFSHGTHVAGIAAGTGAGLPHVGVAYESELVFVQLMRTPEAYIDAINWINTYATSVGKPFVINHSFGGHRGPHDGTDAQNQAVNTIAGPGKIFVGSAGNNGDGPFHIDRDFAVVNDTLQTVVNFRNDIAGSFGQTLSMWGSVNSDFRVMLRFVDGSNQSLTETPWYSASLDTAFTDTLMVGGDSLIFRIAMTGASPLNNKSNISWEVRNPAGIKTILRIHSSNSHVHVWNNVRMNNRYTNWGVNLGNNYPGATAGDTKYGLGEPAGVGLNMITTASHRSEVVMPNGSLGFGQLSTFSSRGPTVDGRTKPDISAPGQNVISAVNSNDDNYFNATLTVSFGGVDYPFASLSGTSMSGPAVAGIAALMLEANPSISQMQVRDIIRSTARLDQRTGLIDPNEGSLSWGWGKVNALAALMAVEGVTGIPVEMNPDDVLVFPNPFRDYVQIQGLESAGYRVVDMAGREVCSGVAEGGEMRIAIPGNGGQVYLLELNTGKRRILKKLVCSE